MPHGSHKHPERRKSGRKNWKRRVADKYGHFCHYCGVKLAIVSAVPSGYRLKETPHWLVYWDPILEGVVTERIFSIEHVTPISQGGLTEIENLRPACKSCNQAHSRQAKTRQPRPCCGGCGLLLSQKRTCRNCSKANAWRYLNSPLRHHGKN